MSNEPFLTPLPQTQHTPFAESSSSETPIPITPTPIPITKTPVRPTVAQVQTQLMKNLQVMWQLSPLFHGLTGAKYLQQLSIPERQHLHTRVEKICRRLAEYSPEEPVFSQKSVRFMGDGDVWILATTLNSDRTISYWFLMPVRLTYIRAALAELIQDLQVETLWSQPSLQETMWLVVQKEVLGDHLLPHSFHTLPEFQQELDPLGAEFLIRILLARGYKCQFLQN